MQGIDPFFRVEVLSKTPNPQQVIYAAMHQDYAEGFVWDERDKFPSEEKCGELIVKNLLAGNRGHFGPLEHPQIVLNCGWFPHSTMQQIRTHRVGISFDVQSFRYTSARFLEAASVIREACDKQHYPKAEMVAKATEFDHVKAAIEGVVYLRPVGEYSDRSGKCYFYDPSERDSDISVVAGSILRYAHKIEQGFSEEHARGLIPFDARQHWVMSVNSRSISHLLDLRSKLDAQLECQQLCQLILPHFEAWVPHIAEWYKANRWAKARLAP